MNNLFQGLYFIHAYIYDLLVLKNVDRKYHLTKLELTINKSKQIGLKFNIKSLSLVKPKSDI